MSRIKVGDTVRATYEQGSMYNMVGKVTEILPRTRICCKTDIPHPSPGYEVGVFAECDLAVIAQRKAPEEPRHELHADDAIAPNIEAPLQNVNVRAPDAIDPTKIVWSIEPRGIDNELILSATKDGNKQYVAGITRTGELELITLGSINWLKTDDQNRIAVRSWV